MIQQQDGVGLVLETGHGPDSGENWMNRGLKGRRGRDLGEAVERSFAGDSGK